MAPSEADQSGDVCVCVGRVGSGHYTAYGSHEGRWYHFNDSTVTLTSEDTVRKAKAYILFYVERNEQADSADQPPSDNVTSGDAAPAELLVKEEAVAVAASDLAQTDASTDRDSSDNQATVQAAAQ